MASINQVAKNYVPTQRECTMYYVTAVE